ncbi:MAG: hypothetical protein RLZZ303_2171, partial [Candidatus Hydrogenedentota bacterium]
MDKILVRGGKPLQGDVYVRGAKNAALPLMAASLLAHEPVVLHNVPCLHDIFSMDKLLSEMGVRIDFTGQTMTLDATSLSNPVAPYDLVRKMRASFFVLGPLLARAGKARVSLPGGCAIGTRPVDLLVMALQRLGAEIEIDRGYVVARAPKGLKGGEIVFPKVTVGGTHTAVMA